MKLIKHKETENKHIKATGKSTTTVKWPQKIKKWTNI